MSGLCPTYFCHQRCVGWALGAALFSALVEFRTRGHPPVTESCLDTPIKLSGWYESRVKAFLNNDFLAPISPPVCCIPHFAFLHTGSWNFRNRSIAIISSKYLRLFSAMAFMFQGLQTNIPWDESTAVTLSARYPWLLPREAGEVDDFCFPVPAVCMNRLRVFKMMIYGRPNPPPPI